MSSAWRQSKDEWSQWYWGANWEGGGRRMLGQSAKELEEKSSWRKSEANGGEKLEKGSEKENKLKKERSQGRRACDGEDKLMEKWLKVERASG